MTSIGNWQSAMASIGNRQLVIGNDINRQSAIGNDQILPSSTRISTMIKINPNVPLGA
jgi:hypothetical protein